MDPDLGDQFIGGRNPYAVEAAPIDLLLGVGMPLFLGSLVVAIVPLVQRYRQSSGVERFQLRWFVFASAFRGGRAANGGPAVDRGTGGAPADRLGTDVDTGRRRHCHPPLPALRHRPRRQPHRRVRHAHGAPRRPLRGGRGGARRRVGRQLGVGHRRRDPGRRRRVRPASRASRPRSTGGSTARASTPCDR